MNNAAIARLRVFTAPFSLLVLLTALFALLVPGIAHAQSGASLSRQLSVTSFDDIRVEGGYVVNITRSARITATASGPRETLDGLDVELRGRTLVVRSKPFRRNVEVSDPAPVVLTLTTPRLDSVALAGSGTVSITGFSGLELALVLDGEGQVDARNIEYDRLMVTLDGAGSINLSGSAQTVEARRTGSGNLDARSLTAKDLDLFARGAGATRFTVSRDAQIDASGAGNVAISGSGQCSLRDGSTGMISCGSSRLLRNN